MSDELADPERRAADLGRVVLDATVLDQAIETSERWGGEDESTPISVVTAADALNLSEPHRVLWADQPAPDDAPVVSVGEVGILAAPSGSGKTYLALDLALAAVSGQTPARACGLAVRPGPVLMASYEDSPARLGRRIRAIQGRAHTAAKLADFALVEDLVPLWAPRERSRVGVEPTAAFYRLRSLGRPAG